MNNKIIYNIVEKIINENIQKLLNESQTTINNFDLIKNLLEFKSADDFYFVQIIKRFKDNPNDNRKIGNYHSGAWYIKGYEIYSVDDLEEKMPEIIALCNKNNARAYVTINSRSKIETDKQIAKVKSYFPQNDPRNIYASQIVPGQAKHGPNWAGKRLRFFVDIDSNDKKIWQECHKIISMCGITPMGEYITPSGGLHILLPNKEDENIEYLEKLLQKFDNWIDKGRLATAHPNFDGKLILYSNVKTKGY